MVQRPARQAARRGADTGPKEIEGSQRDPHAVALLSQSLRGWHAAPLQAQAADGRWLDAPVVPRGLNVNFGDMLSFWTGGRLSA